MLKKIISNPILQIFLLVILAGILRLHRLDAPLADWHSWRQSDTASVTREFVKHNYNITKPHFQDLSNIPSGLDNLEGWRMVEFPLINYLNAKIISAYNLDLVVFSRLSSIFFSLISLACIYLIVHLLSHNKHLAFSTGLVFAILPYNIFYSRAILPEASMIATQLLALLLFIIYLDGKKAIVRQTSLTLSVFFLAISLLLKPTAIFIAPIFIVLAFYKYGLSAFKKLELYLFLFALVPVWWWREYIKDYPSGIPANAWLFNGNGIRFKPAWWRWLFADRLGRLILGYWGTVFVFLGLVGRDVRDRISRFDLFSLTMAGSYFAYLVIFATGNVQHDYYQILLVPTICILIARGFVWLLNQSTGQVNKYILLPAVLMISLLSLFFSWYEVRGYFNINNPAIVEAGERVDSLTSPDAKVIAPYGGDTAFLFQTNRTGWPIGFDIEDKIEKGATHYVTTTYDDEARLLESQFATLEKNDRFLILDLTKPLMNEEVGGAQKEE